MDNVDLCMESEIRYPWIMFTYTKHILFPVNRCYNFPWKLNNTIRNLIMQMNLSRLIIIIIYFALPYFVHLSQRLRCLLYVLQLYQWAGRFIRQQCLSPVGVGSPCLLIILKNMPYRYIKHIYSIIYNSYLLIFCLWSVITWNVRLFMLCSTLIITNIDIEPFNL